MIQGAVRAALIGVLLAALAACNRTGTSAATPDCDRACLLAAVDRYVAALGEHDPSKGGFAPGARFTENAQRLPLGEGLWNTADAGAPAYRLVFADPLSGQASFDLRLSENGNPVWLAGRLRVEHGAVTELETVVLRKGVSFGNYERSEPDPLWDEVVPVTRRRTREEMISIANRYFEAIEQNLADYVPFDESCRRIENGVQTTSNPGLNFEGPDGPRISRLGCRDNINSMMWRYITLIDPRRYLVVDEARGIVSGMFMFHHDGSQAKTEIPGYGEYVYTPQTRRPFTTVIAESFRIVDGRIVRIDAAMATLPYGSRSGWEN